MYVYICMQLRINYRSLMSLRSARRFAQMAMSTGKAYNKIFLSLSSYLSSWYIHPIHSFHPNLEFIRISTHKNSPFSFLLQKNYIYIYILKLALHFLIPLLLLPHVCMLACLSFAYHCGGKLMRLVTRSLYYLLSTSIIIIPY